MTDLMENLRRAILRNGVGLGDDELLDSFIERHDEVALAALVRRHGPMVWGVCRRLLAHHDAEDAFQATFIVLVRKAASIKPRAMVGNWLYGVAHQTALHARRTATRRRVREVLVEQVPDTEAVQNDQWNDLQPVLDEELSRLPDIYRAVVVLCDLEGRTRKEVARQLGVPEGTVGGRLARARVLLAKRLAKRGVVMSGGVLAGVLSAGSAASVSPSLVSSTIKAANLLAAGRAAGVVSVKVAALTEGVVKVMFVSKIKSVLAGVLVVIALGGTTGLICRTQADEPLKAQKPVGGDKQADAEKGKKAKSDDEQFQGVWTLVEAAWEGERGKVEGQIEATLTVRQGTLHIKISKGRKTDIDKFFVYKLDPTAAVKTIDLADWKKGFEEKDKIIEGVYTIDGDTFSMSLGEGALVETGAGVHKRPASLETKKGSKTYTCTFKKEKPW
ncbi:sigma-70 family RNA polymerase sigma factor [Limnoglobus roseus]|uniref:TIGR03067 domain-containing protein n=1 Tax=Limnoglobus roseus TaxID=2598579 RepID=A0A5C1AEK4_9BACT|nr:sigma-70 family RNA polymerase sigma factor [Limnoglobus roseus]QEL17711.1 TIGR03067 domain-containing protein [Limnoglobus roseus]